jgi:ABC-type glycerol-3-phosphate transport system substrate-binding protein
VGQALRGQRHTYILMPIEKRPLPCYTRCIISLHSQSTSTYQAFSRHGRALLAITVRQRGIAMPAKPSPPLSRRAMLRSLAAGLSALGAAALLGACGQSTDDEAGSIATAIPAEAPASTAAAQNTITVWYYDGSISQTVDAFKRANPAIEIDLKTFGDAEQGLLRTLESGVGLPDVCVFSSGFVGALAQRGGLLPLSEAPFDAAALQNDFVAAAWNGALDEQNKLIGMPLSVYPSTYWYRADMLDAAGVESDPEKLKQQIADWPALFAFAKAYTEKQAGSSLLPRAFADVFLPQVFQQGGGLVEKSKLLIEEKGIQPAEQALLARTQKLDLPVVADYGSAWDEAIRNGNIAGLFAPTWFQGYISNIYSNLVGKWRSIPPPGAAYLGGAQYFGIPTKSTNQEAAWTFVKYCCADVDGQNTFLRTSGDFPALRTAWTDPLYDAPVGFFGGQRVYREWAKIADSAQMLATSPYDIAIYDALNTAMRKVVDQELDTESALQGVEQKLMKDFSELTA